MSDKELREKAIFAACLASAVAMKADLKTISWFGRNVSAVRKRAA